MARPVLIIACIAFVVSLGALPYNLHRPGTLVVNVMGLVFSAVLGALALWKLRSEHGHSGPKGRRSDDF